MGNAATMAALLAVALMTAARPAHADDSESGPMFTTLWDRAIELLNEASDARRPALVPPTPIKVRWRARRVSSIELDAPLLALSSHDLDGDGRVELLALTTREVVAIERRGRRKLLVKSRAALPAGSPPIQPRDPVGSMVVADIDNDGAIDIAARASTAAQGARFTYRDGALSEVERIDGFPLCAGVLGELAPGRNYFEVMKWSTQVGAPGNPDLDGALAPAIPERFFATTCRNDLVDPAGYSLSLMAVLATDGTLALWSRRQCRSRDAQCKANQVATSKRADIGVAFALADVNRDGFPEVIATGAVPPGDPDRVIVWSWRGGKFKRLFERSFSGGVVGVTTADLSGDGVSEVVAAVRLWGSTRIDLWTFN